MAEAIGATIASRRLAEKSKKFSKVLLTVFVVILHNTASDADRRHEEQRVKD